MSSNQLAGFGSVFIPIITTAGANRYRRKIRVFLKRKSISSNFRAKEGKLWMRITAVCLRRLGTGILKYYCEIIKQGKEAWRVSGRKALRRPKTKKTLASQRWSKASSLYTVGLCLQHAVVPSSFPFVARQVFFWGTVAFVSVVAVCYHGRWLVRERLWWLDRRNVAHFLSGSVFDPSRDLHPARIIPRLAMRCHPDTELRKSHHPSVTN